jgi:hypothetical protein
MGITVLVLLGFWAGESLLGAFASGVSRHNGRLDCGDAVRGGHESLMSAPRVRSCA